MTIKRIRLIASVLIALIAASAAGAKDAKTVTYFIGDPRGRDVATFTSRAPLETIVGTTSKVSGHITVNPDNVMDKPDVQILVDLASLNTGIERRDGHLRDSFLQTAQYPNATFTLTKLISVKPSKLQDGKTILLKAQGTMEIHGLKQTIIADVEATYFKESEGTKAKMPGDLLVADTEFALKLSQFSINRPQMLFMKLSDDIKIHVNATASTALDPSNLPPPGAPPGSAPAKSPG
ncbi:MAG: YceI family protein [bacterium]